MLRRTALRCGVHTSRFLTHSHRTHFRSITPRRALPIWAAANGRGALSPSQYRYFSKQEQTPQTDEKVDSAAATPPLPLKSDTVPPFPVRVALVGTAVGLATPVFVTGGVIVAWYRFLPSGQFGLLMKYVLGALVGGSIFTLTYNHLMPFLRDHSDFVLPFALSNALTSAFWYTVLEYRMGLSGMAASQSLVSYMPFLTSLNFAWLRAPLPLGGIMVGLLTAACAPFIWVPLVNLCWSDDLKVLILGQEKAASFLVDAYLQMLPAVGLPIGFGAGLSLHYILKPLLMGVPGQAWTVTSLPALVGVLGASALYFSFCKPLEEDLFWEQRVDVHTGNQISVNLRTGERSDSLKKADEATALRSISFVAEFVRRPFAIIFGRGRNETKPLPRAEAHAVALDGSEVRVDQVREHGWVMELFDLLARLKLVEEQMRDADVALPQGGGVQTCEMRDSLLEYAFQRYGVELDGLLEDVQAMCVLTRKLQEVSKSDSKNRAEYGELLRKAELRVQLHVTKLHKLQSAIAVGMDAEEVVRALLVNRTQLTEELEKVSPLTDAFVVKFKNADTSRARTRRWEWVVWKLQQITAVTLLAGLIVASLTK